MNDMVRTTIFAAALAILLGIAFNATVGDGAIVALVVFLVIWLEEWTRCRKNPRI